MKNNFKFLIVFAILLTACICIGSTFAADVSVNDIDNATDLEIAHGDSSQKAVELNNLYVEKTSFNQDNGVVLLNSDNRADVNGGTFEDIQNSITSSNMEIYLHNKTYNGSSQININYDNITIYGGNNATDGLSSTLDAKGLCRIMYLSNSVKTITFVNIRFINGNADKGGAIYVDSNVTISGVNTSFVGNNATDKGGAIYVDSDVTISGVNTSFNDNFAFYGGAIYSYNSDVTINGNDTEFRGNSAKESGGVIYVLSASMCISGVNTSFINNNAPLSGGAIYVDSPFVYSASMCISGVNTIFRGNTAQRGGAIFSYNGNLTINGTDTKFISNSANSDTMGGGGAIYTMKEGILSISGVNTSFIDNYVNASNPSNYSFGGAICIDSGIMCISGVNTSFRGNFAGFGGAIYVSDDNSTIEGAIFINNVASYDVFAGEVGGGAVYIAGNYTTLKNCTFINNTASGLGIEKFYHGTEGGSAVLVSGNNNTIDSCIFINNTVLPANGNYTGDEGGAVFVCGNYTTLKNCTFNNNDAPCAGAVFVCGNYTMIEWCNFTNNVAVGNGTFDGGGAIYLYTSSSTGLSNCTIINCNFINNYVNGSTNSGETKTTDGGAIYSNMDYVTISYSYFEGNFAQKGGAVRMHGNGDYPIHHCSFTGNRAVERGGAVYLADSIFRNLTDCNFTNNSVSGSKSFGGAINIQLGMINNCNFINNSAHYGAGGAIMWDHTYAATEDGGFANNCTFIQNTAHQGSAIYFDNVVNSITLTDVNFINNTADSDHIDISCNQSEGVYTFIFSHYGFNNILDAIYFRCSDSTTKNITINNKTYYPSNENAPRTTVITNVTFIYFEGIETQRVDSGHPYVLNTTNSTNKHLIKVITAYDGPLYTYVSNSTSFNYETEISIGDFSGLTLSNVTSTVNIHIKGDSNATINNTTVNVTLSFKDNSRKDPFYYYYTNVDVIDGKMTLFLPTLNRTNNVTATLKIEFNGNSTYNASNGTTTLNISKRETTMDVSVISNQGNFVFDVKLPENATGKVYIFGHNYYINDKANLTNGIAHFNISNLTPGNYESYFTYDGDDYFKSHSQDFNFTIPTVNIVINPDIISFGENVTIIGNVTGYFDIIPTGNVTIVVYNENYSNTVVKTLSDGEVNCIISGLETGVYYVNVTYNGDDSYLPSMNNTIFVVVNIVDLEVNASGVYDGRITGSINVTCDGIITFIIDEDNFTGSVVNGEFSVVIKGVDAKTYECVHVVFVSDDGGVGATVINLTISPKIISLNGFIFDAYSGTNLTGILVTDGKTGNVNITIDGVVYSGFVDCEGHFVINDTDSLTAGNYDNVGLDFISDDGNCFGNMTVSFTIMDAPTIDNAVVSGNYSETVSFNITVHNAQSGDIVVLHLPDGTNITGKLYVEEGKVEFTTVLPYACNGITTDVIYIRDGVSCAVGNVTWNINKIDTNITLVSENVSIIAGTVKEVEVSVVDSYGNLVTQGQINVTGIGVTLIDSEDGIYDLVDGKVTIKFKYAKEGNYKLNIKYLGGVATNNTDNYYTSDKNLNVFVSSKVLNTYIVSDYNGNNAFEGKIGEQLTLNFTVYDKNGNLTNGGNLSIIVGGKVYTAPVINGHVSITNESFVWNSTGLYIYVVNYISDNNVYADSFNFTTINILKVATQIAINTTTVNDDNVKNGTITIKFTVTDVDGKVPVSKGIIYYVTPDGIEHRANVGADGVVEVTVEVNRTGTYYIAASYYDLDGDFLYSEADFTWDVQKTETLIKATKNGNDIIVTINVGDELGNTANGKVDLFVNGKLMSLDIVNGVGSVNIGTYIGPIELTALFTGENCLPSSDKVILELQYTPENAIDHDEIEEINSLETDSDNNTEDNSTDVNDEFSDVNDDESSENGVKKSFVSGIPMEHTAIPILALLIALITLPIIRRRK